MSANAESVAQDNRPPKRRLRNYLLDRRFQLKYTGMVVAVTVLVAAVLGYFAYAYSRENVARSKESTEVYTASVLANVTDPELQEQMIAQAEDLDVRAQQRHQRMVVGIIAGILILAVTLGLTGIVVTHKVVGPSYKLRRLLRDVADGHLKVEGRLRKGDELQNVFDAFEKMVLALRERQAEEIADLDAALAKSQEAGVADANLEPIRNVRDRMQQALD